MAPLDIVHLSYVQRKVATLRSQRPSPRGYLYLFTEILRNLRAGHGSVAVRQAGQNRPVSHQNNDWRIRCPRASNHSSRLALWPSLRLVVKMSRLKSSLWLIQNRSQLSQPTPANSSKATRPNVFQTAFDAVTKIGGQAPRPACTPAAALLIREGWA